MASPISAFGKRLLLGLRIPAAAPHVDMAVGPEGYVFVFQQDFLFGPGGNRPSLTVHHPVARQAGRCRSPMQRLSYHARAQRPASQRGDLPVGCDAAGRNSPHDVVYFSVKLFAIHRFRRPVRFVCRRNPLSLCIGARFPRCGYGVRSRPVHDDPHSSSGLRGCGGPDGRTRSSGHAARCCRRGSSAGLRTSDRRGSGILSSTVGPVSGGVFR